MSNVIVRRTKIVIISKEKVLVVVIIECELLWVLLLLVTSTTIVYEFFKKSSSFEILFSLSISDYPTPCPQRSQSSAFPYAHGIGGVPHGPGHGLPRQSATHGQYCAVLSFGPPAFLTSAPMQQNDASSPMQVERGHGQSLVGDL